MHQETESGIEEQPAHTVLESERISKDKQTGRNGVSRPSVPQRAKINFKMEKTRSASLPWRTKSTADQSDGSPGVRLTNTPSGQACFNPALR